MFELYQLINLGAAHSGKSEWVLTQLDKNKATTVIGTAVLHGLEERISRLKATRPIHWQHIESIEIFEAIQKALASDAEQIVIDSMNQWLANFLLESWLKYDKKQHEDRIDHELTRIFNLFNQRPDKHILTISSEIGAGITPPDELSRFFRQSLGLINQKFARRANTVVQIVAGLPIFMART